MVKQTNKHTASSTARGGGGSKPADENPIHPNLPTEPAAEYIKEQGSKSNAIRALAADQVPTAAIAKYLDIRYQHARNVLTRPLKNKGGAPTTNANNGNNGNNDNGESGSTKRQARKAA